MYYKILIPFILFLSTISHGESLDFKDKDKQLHFGVSAALTTSSYYLYNKGFKIEKKKSLWLAIGTSLTLGVIKELTDPHFSKEDLLADGLGTGFGILIPLTFDF